MHHRFGGGVRPVVLACAALACTMVSTALAQSVPPGTNLPAVTVTGNPLGATDSVAPVAALTGANLALRGNSTLGETLDGTPGVASSYFGPNASRPIIRGLDGDRVRVLQNSGVSADASGGSADHAVPADPIAAERIEVLRGPATLLYGGSAVGGVVNVIDNRIPQERQFDAAGGVGGRVQLEAASGNAERTAAALLETGTDRYTLHVDGFHRQSGDVGVPVELPCSASGAVTSARAICNSAAQSRGVAVGGAVFGESTRLGASVSSYHSDYGTVAEDSVTIGMRSERAALEWDWQGGSSWVRSLQLRASQSDYAHTEFDTGVPGTTFRTQARDARLQLRHAPWGGWEGALGVQHEATQFSADGDEAFAPYSRTAQSALFAFEELPRSWGRLSAGARWESVQVDSDGHPSLARFAPASRRFAPLSAALGAQWNAAPQWQLSANLAYSERAPKDYELYANGAHVATHAYEVGDPALAVEKSVNLDVGAHWKAGAHTFSLTAFSNRFDNYLSQEASGAVVDGLPEYRVQAVPARFTGLEASARLRVLNAGQTLDLELRGDTVRATNTAADQALPRIAPTRLGASLVWAQGPWGARLDANHATAQRDGPQGQLPVDAYTLVQASVNYRQSLGSSTALWYARLDNATDALAYSATSILTQTAPGKAPLPGRSLKLGVQLVF